MVQPPVMVRFRSHLDSGANEGGKLLAASRPVLQARESHDYLVDFRRHE